MDRPYRGEGYPPRQGIQGVLQTRSTPFAEHPGSAVDLAGPPLQSIQGLF